jgi:hypothetical protein
MPDEPHVAFALAAAQDGIELEIQSFDWLCEQGHVGLERVAKARRDPALVAPVSAALEHEDLCRAWCSRTDGLSRGLAAKGFGFGGVPRERAYNDALKDLAVPAMGHPPLMRIAAVDGDGDGAAAYQRHRAPLMALAT